MKLKDSKEAEEKKRRDNEVFQLQRENINKFKN